MSNDKQSTAFLLGNTLRNLGKHIRKRFAEEMIPVTPEQFGILDMIALKDEFIQSELATLLDKDKSAVLRHIDVLESNKLLVRQNDATDRRKKFIVLTQAGTETIEKCKAIINEIIQNMENGIPEQELEIFRKVLIQLKNNAEGSL